MKTLSARFNYNVCVEKYESILKVYCGKCVGRTYASRGTRDVVGEESTRGWHTWRIKYAHYDRVRTGAFVKVELEPVTSNASTLIATLPTQITKAYRPKMPKPNLHVAHISSG
jgi:hypothetical protein